MHSHVVSQLLAYCIGACSPILLVQAHNIVVGRNGMVIGEIGKRARTELELIFGVRVHLYLHVKHDSGQQGGKRRSA